VVGLVGINIAAANLVRVSWYLGYGGPIEC